MRPGKNRFAFNSALILIMGLVFSSIAFAGSIPISPSMDYKSAIANARSGDVIAASAGTFSFNAGVTIQSGVTITGSPGFASHFVSVLPGGQDMYAFIIAGNASNVTVGGLDIHSSNGIFRLNDGTHYSHIHITGNQLQHGGGSFPGGVLVFGINGAVGCDDLQITHNFWHDSLSSVRSWEIWGDSNSNLDFNRYDNVCDGGHLCEPQNNVSFSYNAGTHMRRMGQEIQGNTPSSGLRVVGNVFYDWVTPYYDSFGLSVVNDKSINTLIASNWLSANIADGSTWGIADGGGTHRFGYGIEAGGSGVTVQGNTVIGNWIEGVCASTPATLTNNRKFGPPNWADYGTEAAGKISGSNNTVDRNVGDAPAMPSIVAAGPGGSAAVAVTPPPATKPASICISDLTATATNGTTLNLAWTNSTPITLATINIAATHGGSYAPITLSGNASSATISGLHDGWQFDATVTGTTAAGTKLASDTVTTLMPGVSTVSETVAPAIAKSVVRVVTTVTTYFSDGSSTTVSQ